MANTRDPEHPLWPPPALLHPCELNRLREVFRKAMRFAFASSLAATGCQAAQQDDAAGAADSGSGGETVRGGSRAPAHAGSGSHAGAQHQPAGGRGGAAGSGGRAGEAAPGEDGGGGELDAGVPDDAGSTETVAPVCGPAWRPFAELEPAEPFDYASLRTSHAYNPTTYNELAAEGTACAQAAEPEACQSAVENIEDGLTGFQPCGMAGDCVRYVVTTREDEVRRYVGVDGVLAFLGAIDSPQDALLLLDFRGYQIACDETRVRRVADGFEANVQIRVADCPVQMAKVVVHVSNTGEVTELSRALLPPSNVCIGRRPEGLLELAAGTSCGGLGAHFASIARLEAASVAAFEVLAAELEHHRAPASLVAAAREAARDEVRHAGRTAALARRFGGEPEAPRVGWRPLRGLEALALDNVVEGCVRETFGAAVGCFQAQAARDPEVAQAMAEIAADETRHAALALAIHGWVWPRLDVRTKAAVLRARDEAVRELEIEVRAQPDAALRAVAGVPDAAAAARLLDVVREELWRGQVDFEA